MTAPNLRGLMRFLALFVGAVLLVSDYTSAAKQTSRAEQIAIDQDNERNADILIPKEGTEADLQVAAAAAKRRSLARKRRQFSYQAAFAAQNSAQQSQNSQSSFYAAGRKRGAKKRNVFDQPFYPSAYADFDEGPEQEDPYNYEFKKKRKRRGNRKRRGYTN